jgi:hypothetical protein
MNALSTYYILRKETEIETSNLPLVVILLTVALLHA